MSFETIRFIHSRLAQTAWLYMVIVGVWSAGYYLRNKKLDGQFFGIIAVGELLMAAQALFGLTMLVAWKIQPGKPVHFLYGVLSLLVFPGIYYYTQDDDSRRSALIWALAGLFMFGVSLRAISTGPLG